MALVSVLPVGGTQPVGGDVKVDINTEAKLHRRANASRYSNVTPRSINYGNFKDDLALSVTNEPNMVETDTRVISGNNEGTPKDTKPCKDENVYENINILESVLGTKNQAGSQQKMKGQKKPIPKPRTTLMLKGHNQATPPSQGLPTDAQASSHDEQAPPADIKALPIASARRRPTRKESRKMNPDTEMWQPPGWTSPPQKNMPAIRASTTQYENVCVVRQVLLDAILNGARKFRQRKINTLEPPGRDDVSSIQPGGTTQSDDGTQKTRPHRDLSMETSLKESVGDILQLLDQAIDYDMTDVSFDSGEDGEVDMCEPEADARSRSMVGSVRKIQDTLDLTAHAVERDGFGADDDESTYIVCTMLHLLDTAVCRGVQTDDAKLGLRHTSSIRHVLNVLDSAIEECDSNSITVTDSSMEGSDSDEYPTSDNDYVRLADGCSAGRPSMGYTQPVCSNSWKYRPAKRENTDSRHWQTPDDSRVETPDICNGSPGSIEIGLDACVPMGAGRDAVSEPITGDFGAECSADNSQEMCDVPVRSETDRREHDARMSHVRQQQASPHDYESQHTRPTGACAGRQEVVAQTTSCQSGPSLSEDRRPGGCIHEDM